MLSSFKLIQPLVYKFAAGIHPQRWEALGLHQAGVARLLSNPRALARLSENLDWLTANANYCPDWDNSLATPAGNWAFLSGAQLWQAGLRLGAGRYRAEIVRLLHKNAIAEFKTSIGADIYTFALRQAPIIWHRPFLVNDAPGCLHEISLSKRVIATAGWGLGCWLSSLPKSLALRIQMKLPSVADDKISEAATWPKNLAAEWLDALSPLLTGKT